MTPAMKYGNKNNWRNWQWNRISERIPTPAKALVLYTPGLEDLDRPVAIRHGFKPHNLIGIDRDAEVVKKMRAEGKLALELEMTKALSAWPADFSYDVIIIDLYGGFSYAAAESLMSLTVASKEGTVVSINMLRGRDGEMHKDFIQCFNTEQDIHAYLHRGERLLQWFTMKLISLTCERDTWHRITSGYPYVKPEYINRVNEEVYQVTKPAFNSYQTQSGKMYDSVVFNWPFDNVQRNNEGADRYAANCIRAIRAVRTMRIHGTYK